MNQQICYVKIDVSCEASINFQHISQNATPATEFAPRHHLTQPWQCDSQKSRCKTRLKCCGCQAKWRWTRPKRCACHENWNPSFKNDAKLKVLRLPHKPTFDTIQNTSECHEVPRLLSETKQRDVWKSKSDPHCKLTIGTAIATSRERTVANGCERLRKVANGCERLQTFANGCAPSSEHTLNPQTHRVKREPLLRIGEKNMPNSRTLYSQKPGTVITKRWNATVSGRRPCASGLHLFCKALV